MDEASGEFSWARSIASALAGNDVDPGTLRDGGDVQRAVNNGIAPLLHEMIHARSPAGLPRDVENELRTAALLFTGFELSLNAQSRHFCDLMAEHDVPALLLKGTPVAHLYYPGSNLRTRWDTDVLVRENDVDTIAELLSAAGYSVSGPLIGSYSAKQFSAKQTLAQGAPLTFDIHWKLSNRVLFRDVLPFEECMANRQAVPALGHGAWSLSKIDLLIHACVHRIAHGRGGERNRLIWLYDIHLLSNAMSETERDAFIEKALDKKIGAVCADALMVSEEFFGPVTSRTSGSYDGLLRNAAREPTARLVNAGKLRWVWADLVALEGLKSRLGFIGELARNQLQKRRPHGS